MKHSEIIKEELDKLLKTTFPSLRLIREKVLIHIEEQLVVLKALSNGEPLDEDYSKFEAMAERDALYFLKHAIDDRVYKDEIEQIVLGVKQGHEYMIKIGEQNPKSLYSEIAGFYGEITDKNSKIIAKETRSSAERGINDILYVFEYLKTYYDVDIFTIKLSSLLKDYIYASDILDKERKTRMNNVLIEKIIYEVKQEYEEMIKLGGQEPESLFKTISNAQPKSKYISYNPNRNYEEKLYIAYCVCNEAEKKIEEISKVLKFLKTDVDVNIFINRLSSLKKDLLSAQKISNQDNEYILEGEREAKERRIEQSNKLFHDEIRSQLR